MFESVFRRVLQAVFGGGSNISVANPLPVTSEVGVDSGTATDGSDTTLEDTAKSWQVNIWQDAILEVDIGGIQYSREIDSNTADTLTFAALPAPVVVAAGCPYRIKTVAGLTVAVSSGNIAVVSGNVAVVSGEVHVMSGQLIAKVSGETVIAKVSGETVIGKISGEVVQVSGQVVKVSGETITQASGAIVIAKISGETITQASGAVVISKISGQTVIAKVSGEVVKVSGQVVQVSGQAVKISGQTVIGKISGQVVVVESGLYVMGDISGQVVQVSGQAVKISGQVVKVSGETITQASGAIVIAKISGEIVYVSGQPVKISGQTVVIQSGSYVMADISGQVVQVSGQIVTAKVSGETVSIQTPTMLKTGPVRTLISGSGGVVLHSGAIKAAVVKALTDNSGIVLVGGSGDRPWYESVGSAQGLILAAGEAQSKDVNDFSAIYVVAQISGDKVCFEGVN